MRQSAEEWALLFEQNGEVRYAGTMAGIRRFLKNWGGVDRCAKGAVVRLSEVDERRPGPRAGDRVSWEPQPIWEK
jgi:hypothetical protein